MELDLNNVDFIACLIVGKSNISIVHSELSKYGWKSRSQPNVHNIDYLLPLLTSILQEAVDHASTQNEECITSYNISKACSYVFKSLDNHNDRASNLRLASWIPSLLSLFFKTTTVDVQTASIAALLMGLLSELPLLLSSLRCVEINDNAVSPLSQYNTHLDPQAKLYTLFAEENLQYAPQFPLYLRGDKCSTRCISMVAYADTLLGDTHTHDTHTNTISHSHTVTAVVVSVGGEVEEEEVDEELDGVDQTVLKQLNAETNWTAKAALVTPEIDFLPGHAYNPLFKHSSNRTKHETLTPQPPAYTEALGDITQLTSMSDIAAYIASLSVPIARDTDYSFSYIELFAGIGGFGQALSSLGGYCASVCEIEQHARHVYTLNAPHMIKDATTMTRSDLANTVAVQREFIKQLDDSPQPSFFAPPTLLFSDVTTLQSAFVPQHDILTAGFPCQPFSRLGSQPGLDDEVKGQLILHVLRLAQETNAKMLFLENVPGLVSLQDGYTLCIILRAISRAGYAVSFEIMDAVSLLPQFRRRIYIIAVRKDLLSLNDSVPRFEFPVIPSLNRCVAGILEGDHRVLPSHILQQRKWTQIQQSSLFVNKKNWKLARPNEPAGTLVTSYRRGYFYNSQFVSVYEGAGSDNVKTVYDAVHNLPSGLAQSPYPELLRPTTEETLEAFVTRVKHTLSECGHELFTDDSVLPVPKNVRYYTQRECSRIMGFPEHFVFPGLLECYHQPIQSETNTPTSKKSKPAQQDALSSQEVDMNEANRAYAMLGNAVCPPIIAAIATSALSFVNNLSKKSHVSVINDSYFDLSVHNALKVVMQSCSESERVLINSKIIGLLESQLKNKLSPN